MWRDDSELTEPAIVISSLGGLVYGKDSLTPKDAYRARMLRKALKKQLGRPRGPRPRGQGSVDHEPPSEILHHRFLPSGAGGTNVNNANSLCSSAEESKRSLQSLSSSNLRARINTRPPSNSDIEAGGTHKRGWRVQGQIAGAWRDKLGRHRRARPSENANKNAILASGSALVSDVSRISSIANASCAGSEVSFEDLVDELRERLPRASLLAGCVAAQQHNGHHVCPGVEAMVSGTLIGGALGDEQHEDPLRRHNKQGGASGRAGGNPGRAEPPVTACRSWTSSNPEEAKELMPPGCLKLRHPMADPMRAHANSQALLLRQNGQRLDSAARVGPQPTLVLPPGGIFFSDGSTYRLVANMEAVDSENASPSATMVAAAKAQERALPLLQVCAVRVAESMSS